MKGYILEYYKYVRYPRKSLRDIGDEMHYKEAEQSILTFGDYDRLTINNITAIERYRDLSDLAKFWIGNRQSILVYSFSDDMPYVYVEKKEEKGENARWGFKDAESGEWDNHLFWAVTELPFRNELREKMSSYEELLQEARTLLNEIIQKECAKDANCRYMLLGTLGTFGIAVFWFSDQYTDILRMVNRIKAGSRFKGERMYLAAHTLFSKNPVYNLSKETDKKVSQIQGKALVQVTLKKWISEQIHSFGTYDRSIKHTSGEYDLAWEMDAKDAFVRFETEPIFDHDKDDYQCYILQTRITLGEELGECELKDEPDRGKESNQLVGDLKKVQETYRQLRDLFAIKIDKTAGMIDTLDSLHCDYRYNVASAVNQSWADDFSYIFLKNMECIKEAIGLENIQGEEMMLILRVALNNLKQQIFHISEANSLNFEIPKCHLRYTGQEDCVLYAYMGIIKEILETVYKLKSFNKQSEIVPIVTVDVVPIIESELYFDKSSYVDKTSDDQDFKILSLNLPHVTFYQIPLYIQYLYHEIYHYAVPEDREKRDYVLGVFLSTVYLSSVFMELLSGVFGNETEQKKAVVSYIKPLLYEIISKNYSRVHKSVTGFASCKRKRETDKVILIGKSYRNSLMEYFERKDSLLREFTCRVKRNLTEGSFKGLSFDDLQSRLNKEFPEMDFLEEMENLKNLFEEVANGKISLKTEVTKKSKNVIDKIMDGLDEAFADIPMIELAQMSLEEYMLFYSGCLNNLMVKPDSLDLSDELKEVVRLGVVLDFYEDQGIRLETIKEKFVRQYMARYISLTGESYESLGGKFKKRRNEAVRWYEKIVKCRESYLSEFDLYRNHCRILAEQSGVSGRLREYNINEKCEQYFQRYRKINNEFEKAIGDIEEKLNKKEITAVTEEICNDLQETFNRKMFEENIRLVNFFQKQKKLTELHDINEKSNKEKRAKNEAYEFPVLPEELLFTESSILIEVEDTCCRRVKHIYALEDFLKEIDSVTRSLEESCYRVFGKRDCPLWYRGQENSAYGLLPGIMRNNFTNREEFNYLAQYQRYLFEEFKYRSDGAPEVMDRSYYSVSDYLALMQHYGVRTNLMDWSEDAFTSLFFSLYKLISHEKRDADSDAAIYIFSPHLYNDARKHMIKKCAKATFCTEAAYKASIQTAEGGEGLIPNIAVNYNQNIYDMFLMGNLEYESKNRYGYINEVTLRGQEEMAYLPLAVYTSRLNPRIRLQSGIFLAYNLYAEPDCSESPYAYMDLENVQDYYLKVHERKEKERFLYKMVIEKDAAKDIAECLKRMGISKERIYPELVNIGERIK